MKKYENVMIDDCADPKHMKKEDIEPLYRTIGPKEIYAFLKEKAPLFEKGDAYRLLQRIFWHQCPVLPFEGSGPDKRQHGSSSLLAEMPGRDGQNQWKGGF